MLLTIVIFCVVHVDGKYEIWTVVYSVMLWNIIYEFESRMHMMFMQFKSLRESKEREKNFALEVAAIARDNNCILYVIYYIL